MAKTKVSIIMPVYNGEKYLHESIGSILRQTLKDFELLVMDDGSTDSSSQILKQYAEKDHRIRLFHQKNQGISKSLNTLIDHAQAEFIARMDGDDIAREDRLQLQYRHLTDYPQTVLVGSYCELFENDQIVGTNIAFAEDFMNRWFLSLQTPFLHSAVMMRKKALVDAGKYRESAQPAEDYDLWIRIKRFGKTENIPKILLRYRINSEGISALNGKKQIEVRDRLALVNLEDIFAHDEIPELSMVKKTLKKYDLDFRKKYVIGKLTCFTACFLVHKGDFKKAAGFFKFALSLDKKRIFDALPNLLLGLFGRAYCISVDYSPFKKKLLIKIHWFNRKKHTSLGLSSFGKG